MWQYNPNEHKVEILNSKKPNSITIKLKINNIYVGYIQTLTLKNNLKLYINKLLRYYRRFKKAGLDNVRTSTVHSFQ